MYCPVIRCQDIVEPIKRWPHRHPNYLDAIRYSCYVALVLLAALGSHDLIERETLSNAVIALLSTALLFQFIQTEHHTRHNCAGNPIHLTAHKIIESVSYLFLLTFALLLHYVPAINAQIFFSNLLAISLLNPLAKRIADSM